MGIKNKDRFKNDSESQTSTKVHDLSEALRVFADNSADSIIQMNDNGNIIYANNNACIMSGYTRDELLQMSFIDIYPSYPKKTIISKWLQRPVENCYKTELLKTSLKRKDGSLLNVETIICHMWPGDEVIHSSIINDNTHRKTTEEIPNYSDAIKNKIISALPLGLILYHVDDDGQIIFDGSNPAALKIISVDKNIDIGKPIQEVFSGAKSAVILQKSKDVAVSGISRKTELIKYNENNIETAYDTWDFQTEPNHAATVFTDITERKQAEKARLESESKTNKIISALPLGVHLYHIESDGRFIFDGGNPAADKILGIDHKDLKNKTIEEAFPQLKSTEIPQRYREAASLGIPWSTEQTFYKEGKINGAFAVWAFQTEPNHMAAVFSDISERKRTDEELARSEMEFRTLFESIPSGAVMLVNEHFKQISSKFLEILGYSQEELLNKHMGAIRSILISDKEYDRIVAEIIDSTKQKGFGKCETTIVRKDGINIDILAYANALDKTDISKGIVITIEDITQRKRAETERAHLQEELLQAQKMESIGRLAGGIAHDFNNLLTAIMGNAELSLMEVESSSEIYSQLTIIKQAADSAADLTKQLLAFSRKQIIDPKVVNLNDIIDNMHKMLVRIIGEDITLKALPQPGLSPIKIDLSQIQQIIINLAVNAKDAMPNGGMLSLETGNVILDNVYCQRHAYATTGEHVMLAISDTGTGISEGVKEHLFEPFFTTKEVGKGTGLGLATVYGAVKQNNGTIDVYSEPGEGTCFKIYFPSVTEEPSNYSFITGAENIPRGSETVLIIEDNPLVLHFSSSVLTKLGYNVLTATSGESAISIVENSKERIDLLMTDVILSGINGKIAAKKISELRPNIKILFNSGYTENAIVAHGVLDKGLHFIGKPFSAYALAAKIRDIFDEI